MQKVFASGSHTRVFNGFAQRVDLVTDGVGLASSINELHNIGDKPKHCDRLHHELWRITRKCGLPLSFHSLSQKDNWVEVRYAARWIEKAPSGTSKLCDNPVWRANILRQGNICSQDTQ